MKKLLHIFILLYTSRVLHSYTTRKTTRLPLSLNSLIHSFLNTKLLHCFDSHYLQQQYLFVFLLPIVYTLCNHIIVKHGGGTGTTYQVVCANTRMTLTLCYRVSGSIPSRVKGFVRVLADFWVRARVHNRKRTKISQ